MPVIKSSDPEDMGIAEPGCSTAMMRFGVKDVFIRLVAIKG